MCRFLPGPAITLPVAVILKRFFTEDFVFILGISDLRSSVVGASGEQARDRGRACLPGPAGGEGWPIAAAAGGGKQGERADQLGAARSNRDSCVPFCCATPSC